MDVSVEELLYQWALFNHPALLQEPELFDGLLRFIHAVLVTAVRQERADTLRWALTTSPS